MSIVAHRKNVETSAAAGSADRAQAAFAPLTVFGYLRQVIVGTARLVVWIAEAFGEARMQRAKIEIELYRSRYSYSSKNDDDLPMVR